MDTTTRSSGTYTVAETAELLGMATSTMYKNIRGGRVDDLKPIRVGNTTRFPKAHIDRLLAGGRRMTGRRYRPGQCQHGWCYAPATQWFQHDESFRFCNKHVPAAHKVLGTDPTPYNPEESS